MTPANPLQLFQSSSMDPCFRRDDELKLRSLPSIDDTCKDWQRHPIFRDGSQPSAG
jgi:hypothetical protein